MRHPSGLSESVIGGLRSALALATQVSSFCRCSAKLCLVLHCDRGGEGWQSQSLADAASPDITALKLLPSPISMLLDTSLVHDRRCGAGETLLARRLDVS